jgi:hypothetical protein
MGNSLSEILDPSLVLTAKLILQRGDEIHYTVDIYLVAGTYRQD